MINLRGESPLWVAPWFLEVFLYTGMFNYIMHQITFIIKIVPLYFYMLLSNKCYFFTFLNSLAFVSSWWFRMYLDYDVSLLPKPFSFDMLHNNCEWITVAQSKYTTNKQNMFCLQENSLYCVIYVWAIVTFNHYYILQNTSDYQQHAKIWRDYL